MWGRGPDSASNRFPGDAAGHRSEEYIVLGIQISTSFPFISPQRAEREPFKLVSLDSCFNQMLRGDQTDYYEQLEGQM